MGTAAIACSDSSHPRVANSYLFQDPTDSPGIPIFTIVTLAPPILQCHNGSQDAIPHLDAPTTWIHTRVKLKVRFQM